MKFVSAADLWAGIFCLPDHQVTVFSLSMKLFSTDFNRFKLCWNWGIYCHLLLACYLPDPLFLKKYCFKMLIIRACSISRVFIYCRFYDQNWHTQLFTLFSCCCHIVVVIVVEILNVGLCTIEWQNIPCFWPLLTFMHYHRHSSLFCICECIIAILHVKIRGFP